MKRVLGDVQAKPDYLVVFLSLGFSLFCLGGWYSTHQKLSTVNKELDVMRRTLRVKVVGEELIVNSRAQEIYESLLKDNRKNGKTFPPDFDATASELKRRGVIHEPVDQELQKLYAEGKAKDYLKNDLEISALFAEGVKKGYLKDESGGSVYPKPKTGVIKLQDEKTGEIYEVEYSGKRPTNQELGDIVDKRIDDESKGKLR